MKTFKALMLVLISWAELDFVEEPLELTLMAARALSS
jgi:hypothetical protein